MQPSWRLRRSTLSGPTQDSNANGLHIGLHQRGRWADFGRTPRSLQARELARWLITAAQPDCEHAPSDVSESGYIDISQGPHDRTLVAAGVWSSRVVITAP
jgi:hypothetical protein